MARTKLSTIRSAPKSKKKRREQLRNIRLGICNKLAADSKIRRKETSSSEQTTQHSQQVRDETESQAGDVSVCEADLLGKRTRSEFKRDSYATILTSEAVIEDDHDSEAKTTRSIVDFCELGGLVSALCCPRCKNNSLSLNTDSRKTQGLAVWASVHCYVCEDAVEERYLAKKSEGETTFDMNRQAVFASLVTGSGSQHFNNLCENMNLPGLHHKTFQTHANKMYDKLPDFESRVYNQTAAYVRKVHAQHHGLTLGKDDVLDISVSFDGTWLTRGHSSHVGAGCVIDLLTGLCIDSHVMSTNCQVCKTTGQKILTDSPEEYGDWAANHRDKCGNNFTGSSGMMEVEAARVLWRRSMDRHKLRYTTLLSDGDAKTFTELTKIQPYGEDVHITKEECVNHVAKRLGTALRNLVTDCRKRGITLGGKGKGQLTQNAIGKLTIFYNRAIRANKTVEGMKKGVIASLYHCFSTDEEPRHELCPPGVDSWCFYQQALAQHQAPGPHGKLLHTPLNSSKLSEHLMPIYKRLSDDELLKRCVSGKTQNSNECLHSLIWARCQKGRFASRKRVQFAVITAIREFYFGGTAAQDTAQFFGFYAGYHMRRLGAARLQKRVQNSLKEQRDNRSKRRDKVRAAKLRRQQELLMLEDGPAYAAGQF